MAMLGVHGEPMSHAILGRYLDDLARGYMILFRAEYVDVYDTPRRRIESGLRQVMHYWQYVLRSYREILSVLMRIEALCQARMAPRFWSKFECCKKYLQLQTAPRTPSPNRERRGSHTPQPERTPRTQMHSLLQQLLVSA